MVYILRGVSSAILLFMFLQVLTFTKLFISAEEKSQRGSVMLKRRLLHTRNLVAQYVNLRNYIPPRKDLNDKYIIYRCNTTRLCGGLADRQKGIITPYLISQMLGRKFGIIMTKGCDFSKFVIPNDVDWIVREDELNGRSVEVKRLIDNKIIGYTMRDQNLEDIFDKDVTYYEGNIDYVNFLMEKSSIQSLQWAKNRSHHDIYRIAFAQLFKFSPGTQHRYEEFQEKTRHSSIVCAHLRMGKSITIPKDNSLVNKHPKPEVVIPFLRESLAISPTSKLFIATDSEEVRQQMRSAFPDKFVDVEGQIVHIDRYGQDYDCLGWQKAILDQFILSTCDTLVMSMSGFSRLASILRDTDDNLYLADPQKITKTRRLNPTHPY